MGVAIDIDCGHNNVNHEISSLTPKLQPTQFSLLGLSQRAGSFIEFIRARNMATGPRFASRRAKAAGGEKKGARKSAFKRAHALKNQTWTGKLPNRLNIALTLAFSSMLGYSSLCGSFLK